MERGRDMMRLKDLSIKSKMFLVYGISIFFIGSITLVGFFNMLQMKNSSRHIYDSMFSEGQRFIQLKTDIEYARRALLQMLNEKDLKKRSEHELEMLAATGAVDDGIGRLLSDVELDSEIMEKVQELNNIWGSFKKTRDKNLLPALKGGKRGLVSDLAMGLQQERFSKLIVLSDSLIKYENSEALIEQKNIEKKFSAALRLYFVLSFVGFLLVVGLLRYLSRDIGDRLKNIERGVRSIEEGNMNPVINVEGKDEIAVLADGFNKMSKKLYEDSVAREQYHEVLEWETKSNEKKAKELEYLNSTLVAAQNELSAKNKELEETVREIREANQKLAETKAQMIQSDKMASIGQLAAGVAHEINNPVGFVNSNLNSLGGYLRDFTDLFRLYCAMEEAVRDGRLDDACEASKKIKNFKDNIGLEFEMDDSIRLIEESREGTERILSIVRALKDFSHSDDATYVECDINRCLENVIKIAWNEVKYKAELVKEFGDLPLIPCRPQQISQVFLNIIVNAAQAIPGKGRINIRTYVENGHLMVETADTGAGIPEDVVKRIFDPFFTTKPVGKGTGLGLSIAWGIVTEHGGYIDVKSKVGEGTTFTVMLPVIRNAVFEVA